MEATLGGYMAQHGRAAAFGGSDGHAYSVGLYVDDEPDQRPLMLQRTGGQRTVPQIFIGELHVGGYDELAALDRTQYQHHRDGLGDGKQAENGVLLHEALALRIGMADGFMQQDTRDAGTQYHRHFSGRRLNGIKKN